MTAVRPLLQPSHRLAFASFLHATLSPLLAAAGAGAQAEARVLAVVEEWTADGAGEWSDAGAAGALAAAVAAFLQSPDAADNFAATVISWLVEHTDEVSEVTGTGGPQMTDGAAADPPPSPPSLPCTPSRSGSLASLARHSGRKRRAESDDEEKGEAEGAISGSGSKRRREDGRQAAASPLSLSLSRHSSRGRTACFDFTRSGHCARGLGCHFAHTSAAVSVPVSPANRPGMAATYPHQAAAAPLPHHDARVLVAMLQQQTAQVPPLWRQPCAIVRGFLAPQSPLQQHAPQPIARSLSLQHPSAVARSPGLQRASSFSAPSTSATAAASAVASCKLCVSHLPSALFSQSRLTDWFAAFGEVSSLMMMPPDRCVVQFATHPAALAAFGAAADRERPVLGDAAIRVQWVVPKGTNAAAGVATGTVPSADERTEEVTVISSRSGKEITLTRKVRPPPQLITPDAGAAAGPHMALQRAASTSAFLTRDGSHSAPQLTRPLSASAVLVSHSAASAVSQAAAAAAAAVPIAAASPLRARSYSNGSVVAGPGSSVANPHATATVPSLRALLVQTEGVLARLAAASSPADSEPMQRSLRAKIAALRMELERRGCTDGLPSGSASASSSPALAAVAVAPAPLSLPLPLYGNSCSSGHSSFVSASPTRSHSGSSLPGSAVVAEQLRLQRESALRAQHAQSRALHSKQRLDEEMDAIRKEAQLSSICEMEENSIEAPIAGEEKK